MSHQAYFFNLTSNVSASFSSLSWPPPPDATPDLFLACGEPPNFVRVRSLSLSTDRQLSATSAFPPLQMEQQQQQQQQGSLVPLLRPPAPTLGSVRPLVRSPFYRCPTFSGTFSPGSICIVQFL